MLLALLMLFSAPAEVYLAFILVGKEVWGDMQAIYLLLFIFTAWQAPRSPTWSLAHTTRCGSSSRQTVSATCWDSKQRMKVMQHLSQNRSISKVQGWSGPSRLGGKGEGSSFKYTEVLQISFFLKPKLCCSKNSFPGFFSMKAAWLGDASLPGHLLRWKRAGAFQLMATDCVCERKWDQLIHGFSRLVASTTLHLD